MPEGGSGNAHRACASLDGRRSPSAHFEHGTHCGSAGDEDLHRGADRRVKVAIDHNAFPGQVHGVSRAAWLAEGVCVGERVMAGRWWLVVVGWWWLVGGATGLLPAWR